MFGQVRQPRGKSLESLEDIHDNSTRSHLTFSHYTTTDYGHFAHPSQIQQQQALQQHPQHHLQQVSLVGGAGSTVGGLHRILSNPNTMVIKIAISIIVLMCILYLELAPFL